MEELSSKKMTSIVTPWIEWEKMCSITSGENSSYSKTYSLYKSKVLNKAIDEINAKTDLNITMLEQKESRKIKRIAFKVTKTNHNLTDSDDAVLLPNRDLKVKEQVFQIMGNTPVAVALWESHSDERLREALNFYRESIVSADNSIKNPVAYFKKAVEEGWYSSAEAADRIQMSEFDRGGQATEISFIKPGESEQIAKLRKLVYDEFGYSIYMAWFEEAFISIKDTTCVMVHPNAYAPTYILQKLYHPLLKHIKMVEPSVLDLDIQQKQFQLV